MIAVQIDTYWNVETLYTVFNAVSAMMQGDGFSGLLKMIFTFALGIGMFGYVNGKQLEMFTWFFQALAFVTILNLPIATVTITDTTGMQPTMVVGNVPFAMAIVGETVNLTFSYITEEYETAFGLPSELGVEQGDVGFGHRILKEVGQSQIQDPGLRADLLQFFKNCTLYDIQDGVVSTQTIEMGTGVFNTIFTNSSPARFTSYNTLTATPIMDTCQNVGGVLKTKVDAGVTAAQNYYGHQMFPLATTDAMAANLYVNAIGASSSWVLHSSQQASDAINQAMFNNMWAQAGSSLPAMLNDPSQVAEVNALAGEAQAAVQGNTSNNIMALLGQETLPHLRNWIEAILYALFPIIIILMVTSTTEGAKKILGGYMMSLAWLGLWPVLFAIINHLSLMYLQHKANALSLAGGVPFQLSGVFSSTLVDEQSVIGYMVVLVPFMAAGIIKMGQGGFMSVADRAITGFTSAGAAAGSSWGAGNITTGNASLNNDTVNSTSMNKYDSTIDLAGGGARIERADGSVLHVGSNGTVALSQMHNDMLARFNVGQRTESGQTKEAHRGTNASSGSEVSSSGVNSATGSTLVSSDRTRGTNQQTGTQVSSTSEGQHSSSVQNAQAAGTDDSSTSDFRNSAGAYDSAQAGLSVGGGGGAPSAAGGASSQWSKIESSMRAAGASPAQIAKAKGKFNTGAGANGGGGRGGADLGFQSSKFYNAEQSKGDTHSVSASTTETGTDGHSYTDSGSVTTSGSSGEQSGQSTRTGFDATLSNSTSNVNSRDAKVTADEGVSASSRQGSTYSVEDSRDVLSDPEVVKQIAADNGMSQIRFYNQGPARQEAMAREYLDKKGMLQSASQLNTSLPGGKQLPATPAAVDAQHKLDGAHVGHNIKGANQTHVRQVGAGSTEPVQVDTKTPVVVGEAKGAVSHALDPHQKDSIAQKSAPLKDHVKVWASPDKLVGKGSPGPMAMVEDSEENDLSSTVSGVLHFVTGHGGEVDGKPPTAAERTEVVPDIEQ